MRVKEWDELTRRYLGQEAYEGLKGNVPLTPNAVDVIIQKYLGYG